MASTSLAALVVLTAIVAVADEKEWVWKTEPFAANCQLAEGPKPDPEGNLPDSEQDVVLYKCKNTYGPPMWVLYQDSARLSIGFGERANTVWTGARFERGNWPLEWGGTISMLGYEPKTVTLRLTNWDGDQTTRSVLYVYKLFGNEPACIVARADRNEEAREVAISTNESTKCLAEAEVL